MRILTILALVFVLGCSQADVQEKVVPPDPTPEEVTQPDPFEEVALPDPPPAAEPETVKTLQHGPPSYGEYGVATLEEMLASSVVIIRGRLNSVRGVGVKSYLGHQVMWISYPPDGQDGGIVTEWTADFETAKQSQYFYLPQVAMHELGHFLGLGHGPVGSIMGPYHPTKPVAVTSPNDRHGLREVMRSHNH